MPNRSKYSQKLAKQICEFVEEGKLSVTEICKNAGISRRMYYTWQSKNTQFAASLARARGKKMEKETEKLKMLSLRGMKILMQGGFFRQVETKTFYDKDGKVSSRQVTVELKYIEPCLKTILFVLNNKDAANWGVRLKRHINYHTKRLNTEANRVGARVITIAEAASLGMSSITFESNVEHKP